MVVYICGNCGAEVEEDSLCPCYIEELGITEPTKGCVVCCGTGIDFDAEFDRACLVCGGAGEV